MRFPLRATISRRTRRATGPTEPSTAGLQFHQHSAELQEAPPQVPPTVELPNIGTWGNGQQTIGDGAAGGHPGDGTGDGTGNNTSGNGGNNQAGQGGDEGGHGQGTGSTDGLLANAGNPTNVVTNGVLVMPLGQPAPAVVTHATANGSNHPELSVTLAEGNDNNADQADNAAADTGADADTPLGKRIRARAFIALRLDEFAAMVLRLRNRVRGQYAANAANAANTANTTQPSALANATGTLGVPE